MSSGDIGIVRLIFLLDQFGLIPSEHYPDVAADLLVGGYDSPALRELAGHPKSDPRGAGDLWIQARDELGKPFEDDSDARRTLARHWLQEIVDGILDPRTGAARVIDVAWFALGQPPALNSLVADLDFWDELPERRDEIRHALLVHAQTVLDTW